MKCSINQFVLMALAIALGCSHPDSVSAQRPFRIATFNMRTDCDKGEHAWVNRLPLVVKVIEDNRFDVIGAQELKTNQVADLRRALGPKGYDVVGRRRTLSSKYDTEGVYLLFRTNRFECLESGTFQLSETPEVPGSKSWKTDYPRTCVWADLTERNGGGRFLVYNTHLDNVSEEARRKGAALIVDRISAAGDTPAFLLGDFNCTPTPYNAVGIAHRSLKDAAEVTETPHAGPERTFTNWKPTAHFLIDYIFVNELVRVLSHKTHDDLPDGKSLSDHFPVSAEVVLK